MNSSIHSKLVAASEQFEPFVRNKQAFNYKYADLDAILSATVPALRSQGLSVHTTSELTEIGGKAWMLMTGILSDGTTEIKATIPMPLEKVSMAKVPAQDMGSTITYGRRYVYCALLNLTPSDEDIDGAPVETVQPKARPAPIAPAANNNPIQPKAAPAPILTPIQKKKALIKDYIVKHGKETLLQTLDISDLAVINSWDEQRLQDCLDYLAITFSDPF